MNPAFLTKVLHCCALILIPYFFASLTAVFLHPIKIDNLCLKLKKTRKLEFTSYKCEIGFLETLEGIVKYSRKS